MRKYIIERMVNGKDKKLSGNKFRVIISLIRRRFKRTPITQYSHVYLGGSDFLVKVHLWNYEIVTFYFRGMCPTMKLETVRDELA